MNKKIIMAVVFLLSIVPTTSIAAVKTQDAVVQPSLAIIDTALDTSLPIFAGKVAYEVCILEWKTCPNSESFMEGPGSASMPLSFMATRDFNHGTQMTSIAVSANPNMKIVFIRIIGNTSTGSRQLAGPRSVENALKWIIDNQSKYNIQAVAMSQGHHNLLPKANYCPLSAKIQNQLTTLLSLNVPFFTATGNVRDYKQIDWPACLPEAVAVAATDQQNEIAMYSNVDPNLTDFFALGNTTAFVPGGAKVNAAGTSASAQIAAAQWIQIKTSKPGLSYQQQYDLMKNTSISTKGRQGTFKALIDLQGALNA